MSEPITLRQWTDVVRRARLGRTVKAIALLLATYADSNGARVFPGTARIAYECEVSYNVVVPALATLRNAGLIQLVRKSTRRGDADEYRLYLGENLLERVDVPTPAAADKAINDIRDKRRGKYRDRSKSALPTSEVAHGPEDEECATHGVHTKTECATHLVGGALPTPLAPTYQDHDTTTTAHSDEEVFTDLTVTRETLPDEDQISDEVGSILASSATETIPVSALATPDRVTFLAPTAHDTAQRDDQSRSKPTTPARGKCPHGNNTRPRKGSTTPRCEVCRTETAEPPSVAESIPVPIVTKSGTYAKTKCADHGLPAAGCTFCRRERKAA